MISLIIPMYNSEKTIANTLQSVINQTVTFTEVIVVDNGSSDQSANIVSEICKQHPNIHLFTCQEKGVSAARNMGILQSKSPYIGFLDADDVLSKDYVEVIRASIEAHPDSEMHHFNFQQEFKNGIIKENSYFLNDKEIYRGSEFMEETLKRFSFEAKHMVWSFIFKSTFLQKYDLKFNNEMPIFEDILFLQKAWSKNKEVTIINQSLVTYKYGEKSLTNIGNFQQHLEALKKLKETLPNQDVYLKKLSSRMLRYGSFKIVWTKGNEYYIYKIEYYCQRVLKKIKGRLKQ